MAYPGFYRFSNSYDWKGENNERRESDRHPSTEREDSREAGRPFNRYIRGVHEESDFSFGSDFVRDERAYRPSRLSRDAGARRWINVGDSANSGDSGGRSYTSSEYNENPAYYDGDVETEPGQHYYSSPTPFRDERPFGMSSYPQYFRKSFAGRGPKGYRRSDERITEDICDRLTQDPYIDATGITVETKDGEVVLEGTVTNRDSKRRAEDIADSCAGVKEVQNRLRIHAAM